MRVLGAALVLVTVGGAGFLWKLAGTSEPVPHVIPFTSDPGLDIQPSLSPDGNYVAYTRRPADAANWDVYVKQIGSETVRRLHVGSRAGIQPEMVARRPLHCLCPRGGTG
jgi:hypothetical protein